MWRREERKEKKRRRTLIKQKKQTDEGALGYEECSVNSLSLVFSSRPKQTTEAGKLGTPMGMYSKRSTEKPALSQRTGNKHPSKTDTSK